MSEITSAKAPKLCLCGCSQTTGSMFRMGHDARMVSNLLKDIKAGETTPAKAMKALPVTSTSTEGADLSNVKVLVETTTTLPTPSTVTCSEIPATPAA